MSKFRVARFKPAALVIGALALTFAGTAKADIAQMTSPTPKTTLSGASVTFTWTTGTNVLQYYLYVGSVFGGNDLYGASQATNTSGTVNNLPTDGRLLYVRLWSFVNNAAIDVANAWQYNDYQYQAFNSNITCGALSKAAITSPTPGTTLAGTAVT
ncbi:MAG TPA: hypothetical protein VGZ73_24525, partial [Bryobacteraceae bacterium]|nr:hypothetical protein [Bryobacteraceae bacterium]